MRRADRGSGFGHMRKVRRIALRSCVDGPRRSGDVRALPVATTCVWHRAPLACICIWCRAWASHARPTCARVFIKPQGVLISHRLATSLYPPVAYVAVLVATPIPPDPSPVPSPTLTPPPNAPGAQRRLFQQQLHHLYWYASKLQQSNCMQLPY